MVDTQVEEKNKLISEALRQVMKMYRKALDMKWKDRERLILVYFKGMGEKHEELSPFKQACESVLDRWKEGSHPHDSTLIEEVSKIVKSPYNQLLPKDDFDEDMLVYKWIDLVIADLFNKIRSFGLDKRESSIVDRLWSSVHNTLVENPNFKGSSPYYKRSNNRTDYDRAKVLWLELMDHDFNSYIEYFEEK
jgi:hypothetical protein